MYLSVAHCLHGQLRSGGMQAVRSFTSARSPSPRSAAMHQIKSGLTGSSSSASTATVKHEAEEDGNDWLV